MSDGSNLKYLVKLQQAAKPAAEPKEAVARETVSSWELERLGTALSTGDHPLPIGVALKIAN
jgi:hypothetical protein